MILPVYRDSNGKVINIGPWDFLIEKDDKGNDVITNPIPAGLTVTNENIVELQDGSRTIA